MRVFTTALVATIALAGAAFAADPLEGMWKTTADDNGNSGLIQVAPCGAKLCGTLVKAFDANGKSIASDNIGKKIISNTVAQGGGLYKGKVYSPDRDKTYSSRLTLSGNRLAVQGCVLGICRDGGNWVRQ